jgi:hypothetical protein
MERECKEMNAMKKFWILIGLCLVFGGCQAADESEKDMLQEKDQEILILTEEVQALEDKLAAKTADLDGLQEELESARLLLEKQDQVNDLFPMLANHALAFVRAHTTGDLQALETMISKSIQLSDREGVLVASWFEDNQAIEWTLWEEDSDLLYQDMVIQGYGLLPDGRILIHIREFYARDGEDVSPPTFLTLYFQEEGDGWIVSYFEFDV